MTSIENWLTQVTKVLEEVARTKKLSSLGTLQDHMRRINLPADLHAIGCDETCAACNWSIRDGHPLQNPCRLAAFQETILGMDPGDKLSASLQKEAGELLRVLKTSPRPRKG